MDKLFEDLRDLYFEYVRYIPLSQLETSQAAVIDALRKFERGYILALVLEKIALKTNDRAMAAAWNVRKSAMQKRIQQVENYLPIK